MAARRRHWVRSSPAPGMAAAQPADPQPRSPEDSVCFQGAEKVSRARRFEAASRPRSAQNGENRRNEKLITSDKKTREKEHQGARIEARSARRNHSSFSSRWLARAACGRATRTIQKPGSKRSCSFRTMSRNRRRTRLRTTAPPSRFVVINPARKAFSSFRTSTPKTSNGPR